MIDNDTVVTKSTSPHATSAAQKVAFASCVSISDTVIIPHCWGRLGPNRDWRRDNGHINQPGSGLHIGSIAALAERGLNALLLVEMAGRPRTERSQRSGRSQTCLRPIRTLKP